MLFRSLLTRRLPISTKENVSSSYFFSLLCSIPIICKNINISQEIQAKQSYLCLFSALGMDCCFLFLEQFAQTMDDKFRVSCLKHCYIVVAVAHGAGVAAGAVSHLNIEGGVAHYEGGIRREVHLVEEF